jgi:hypothetical protein
MKALLKKTVDFTIVPFLYYIRGRVPARPPTTTIFAEIERLVCIECANYAQSNMQNAVAFYDRTALWDHALGKISIDGMFAEFGVFRGESINYIASSRQNEIIYGFDSFEGLKEDWAGDFSIKGTFDLSGKPPRVASNVRLIKGWFDETIPAFLAGHPDPFAFIHVDCDTYEATETLLRLIDKRIQKGTVIIFDEYFGYRGWKIGEFKAWQDLVSSTGIAYEYLGLAKTQVSIRVLSRS